MSKHQALVDSHWYYPSGETAQEDEGSKVLVTSEEVFELLEKGATKLWPVAVPRESVSSL